MTLTTSQLVQPTANIVTVISLKKGDVYKRLEEPAYAGASPTLKYGIVTDVLHNGTNAVIVALEYESEYGDPAKVLQKTFATDTAPAFFEASPEEFDNHLKEMVKTIEAKIKTTEKAVQDLKEKATVIRRVRRLQLTAAESGTASTLLLEGTAVAEEKTVS